MRPILLIGALAACHHGAASPAFVGATATGEPGVSIALYAAGDESYALVDDRRVVELGADHQLLLADLDPAARLDSFVIEPAPGLTVGACSRIAIVHDTPVVAPPQPSDERIVEDARGHSHVITAGGEPVTSSVPALDVVPVVRCEAKGKPGKYALHLVYISPGLRFRAETSLVATIDPTTFGTAAIMTTFAIPTPNGNRGPATATLFDGKPGGTKAPREVARGTIALDGSTAILATPVRNVPVQMKRIFEGAIVDPGSLPSDARWGRESSTFVRAWLELQAELPAGEIVARIVEPDTTHDVVITPADRGLARVEHRVPLWIDGDLRPGRERPSDATPKIITDRFKLSIANRGGVAREVWIEERLRPNRDAKITAGATKIEKTPRYARVKLTAPAGEIVRVAFSIEYR